MLPAFEVLKSCECILRRGRRRSILVPLPFWNADFIPYFCYIVDYYLHGWLRQQPYFTISVKTDNDLLVPYHVTIARVLIGYNTRNIEQSISKIHVLTRSHKFIMMVFTKGDTAKSLLNCKRYGVARVKWALPDDFRVWGNIRTNLTSHKLALETFLINDNNIDYSRK